MQTSKLIFLLVILGAFCLFSIYSMRGAFGCKTPDNTYTPVEHVWNESLVEVSFKDGNKDTLTLDINDSPEGIWLENGNLKYDKAWYKSGGGGGSYKTAASYVRSFKIIKTKRLSLTY